MLIKYFVGFFHFSKETNTRSPLPIQTSLGKCQYKRAVSSVRNRAVPLIHLRERAEGKDPVAHRDKYWTVSYRLRPSAFRPLQKEFPLFVECLHNDISEYLGKLDIKHTMQFKLLGWFFLPLKIFNFLLKTIVVPLIWASSILCT